VAKLEISGFWFDIRDSMYVRHRPSCFLAAFELFVFLILAFVGVPAPLEHCNSPLHQLFFWVFSKRVTSEDVAVLLTNLVIGLLCDRDLIAMLMILSSHFSYHGKYESTKRDNLRST
jgi:hypothetical protein